MGAVVVLFILGSAIALRFFPEAQHPVPESAVLTLDLADGISERGASGPLAWASFGHGLTIRDLVQGLDAAGRDKRVRGLVARLGAGELQMARAQEIRDAVLAFRQHGKFAIAFAETFGEVGEGNTHYYLATAFDEIWLQPSGDVGLNGVRLESPYFKPALDALGVVTRIDQREEYKGAFDPLTSASMPQPVRENYQRLVDSWVQQIADGIAQGRKLDSTAARALIDRGPFLADEALKEKLVDKLGYWDELQKAVDERANAGPEKPGDKIGRMKLVDYAAGLAPPANAPRIALVYGLGPVLLTAHKANPLFAEETMDSDTVSRAIRNAAEDKSVRAIIFRVDSPGGSYVASDTIWRAVEQARAGGKPVIVTMGDVAASGGYFVAAPADEDRGAARHHHRLDRRDQRQGRTYGHVGETERRLGRRAGRRQCRRREREPRLLGSRLEPPGGRPGPCLQRLHGQGRRRPQHARRPRAHGRQGPSVERGRRQGQRPRR